MRRRASGEAGADGDDHDVDDPEMALEESFHPRGMISFRATRSATCRLAALRRAPCRFVARKPARAAIWQSLGCDALHVPDVGHVSDWRSRLSRAQDGGFDARDGVLTVRAVGESLGEPIEPELLGRHGLVFP